MRWAIVALFTFMTSGILLAVALTNVQEVSKSDFDRHDAAIKILAQALDQMRTRELLRYGETPTPDMRRAK